MDPDAFAELKANVAIKVGEIISKPKMSDKLLSKPPFRFLHDTISAIINTTGFAEGLYTEVELSSEAIKDDKHAKIGYLEKMFNMVGICKVSDTTKQSTWNLYHTYVCILQLSRM